MLNEIRYNTVYEETIRIIFRRRKSYDIIWRDRMNE